MDLSKLSVSNGSGEAVRGLVTVLRSPGGTVITPNSLVNWPTNFVATTGPLLADGTLDPAKTIVFSGSIVGSTIVIGQLAPGYVDTFGSAVGDVVVIKPNTWWADTLVNQVKVAHNNDGTLKTNIVGTTKIADDAVTAAKIDWASTGANAGIWWEEIGRASLTANADILTVSSLPARKYLRLQVVQRIAGVANMLLRFNGDATASYNYRASNNGAADGVASAASFLQLALDSDGSKFSVVDIYSQNGIPKFAMANTYINTGLVPERREIVGNWTGTADITSLSVTNAAAGDMISGTEIVVLGHN